MGGTTCLKGTFSRPGAAAPVAARTLRRGMTGTAATLAARPRTALAGPSARTSGRAIAWGLGACVALAALSLIAPSQPTYDPWSWILWGREIAHGELSTTFGPSWKPLPVALTTLFSL